MWEGGGSPRRRAIFKDYKKGRRPQRLNRYYLDDIPDTVQNRDNQISLIIEALKCVPAIQMYIPDCEADDIIAYIAKNNFKENRCVIVSSDKDFYQLLSPTVIQWSPGQKKYITPKTLLEKFGISAANFCTVRSFIGDESDSIDGVGNAGFKSLSKRFPKLMEKEFVSIDDLLKMAKDQSEKKPLKLYDSMIENCNIAKRNWKLMYLDTVNLSASQIDKIQFSLEDKPAKGDKMSLMRLFLREGTSNFNTDAFFASLMICRRKKE